MRKFVSVLLTLCLVGFTALSEPMIGEWDSISRMDENKNLYWVCKDGKWGMEDGNGNILLKAQFREIPQFEGDYAVVAMDYPIGSGYSFADECGALYGLIDCNGNIVIPCVYDQLDIFETSALVEIWAGKYGGFMRLTGENLSGLKYSKIQELTDEYFAVKDAKTNLWGIYYCGGREIIPCAYDHYSFMDNWSMYVTMYDDNGDSERITQFCLKNGNVENLSEPASKDSLLPENYDQISRIPNSENLLVRKGELWGMIDPEGKVIFKPQFNAQPEFIGGYAISSVLDPAPRDDGSGLSYGSFYGVISDEGETILEAEYYHLERSDDGLMILIELGDTYKFLNLETGEELPGAYDRANVFYGDYAAVGMKGAQTDKNISAPEVIHWGTIDRNGKIGIMPGYEFLKLGDRNIALVALKEKYGYVRADGEEITRCVYDNANPFKGGYATVAKNVGVEVDFEDCEPSYNRWGLIDENGDEILPCVYDSLKLLSNGLLRMKINDRYGLINTDGEVLLQAEYLSIEDFVGEYAKIASDTEKSEEEMESGDEYSGTWGVVNSAGQVILSPEYDEVGFYEDGTIVAEQNGRRYFFEVQNGQLVSIEKPEMQAFA